MMENIAQSFSKTVIREGYRSRMLAEEHSRLKDNVVEHAVLLRKKIASQASGKTEDFEDAVKAYEKYGEAISELIEFRKANGIPDKY
jgi:hypothetical protein